MKKERGYESKYTDEKSDKYSNHIEELEKLNIHPWIKTFNKNVLFQTQKKNIKLEELISKANKIAKGDKMFLDNLTINKSTISQNLDSSESNKKISATTLIILSKSLDVSIDYLIGIDKFESKEKTDIESFTQLNPDAIDNLTNHNFKDFINFLLTSKNFCELSETINSLVVSPSINKLYLESYRELFKKTILKAEKEYGKLELYLQNKLSYIECFSKEFDNLIKELSITNTKHFKNFFLENTAYEVVKNIENSKLNKSNITNDEIFDLFINAITNSCYDHYYHGRELDSYIRKLSNIFETILHEYLKTKIKEFNTD